jgi:YidC/Oxa1 family membrane protein insertase
VGFDIGKMFQGLWHQFQGLIFGALQYLHGMVGDWGLAIILLTVAIRIVLLPLTWKQTKSMLEMQRIQPKIKELQVKYKDDKEKLQEETLKFYQENKVNPLGGCLPALLQMPVFFALYSVLGYVQVKGKAQPGMLVSLLQQQHTKGTFYGIIPDISISPSTVWAAHDYLVLVPYVVLVLFFAISIWLPQFLMPGDKTQKQITGYMAIMMLAFGWFTPAGVLLYWDVSSMWGVAQQQITMSVAKRELARAEEAGAPAEPMVDAEESSPVAKKRPSNKKSKKS